ncbi:MAG: beta-lactamase domain-containing protein [Anaerolineaceae bacterium]|nr:MAG: beta-lactamase domain-containing protein [Anaerolineaceae bacterium]
MKIAANIHIIPGVTAHPYLLVDSDGLTLIDTGIPGSANKILRYIKQAGYARRDLNRILLTHADYDHAGSLAALKKATGARVYASLFEARAVATGQFPRSLKTDNIFLKPVFALAERLGRISPAHVDEHLSDGQVLPVLGGLFVVDTKGHTPGHLSFFAPSVGVLFSGDSILSVKDRLVGSHGSVTWDQEKADASVLKQLALKARIVCSGHGAVEMDGLARLIKLAEGLTLAPAYQRL